MAVHLANDHDLPGDFCRYQARVQDWELAHNAAYRRYFSGRSALRRACGTGCVFTARGIDHCRVDDYAESLRKQTAYASVRKRDGEGKRESVRVDIGGRSTNK